MSAEDWDEPAPCDGWDVSALVNHVVGANRRHRMLLHGACTPAAAPTRIVDHLGADPIGVFAARAAELAAAFAKQGALVTSPVATAPEWTWSACGWGVMCSTARRRPPGWMA